VGLLTQHVIKKMEYHLGFKKWWMGTIKHAQRVQNSTLIMVFTLFVDDIYKK